jgi:hypothetical protein
VEALAAAAARPDILALALGDRKPFIGVLLAGLVIEHHAHLDRPLVAAAQRHRHGLRLDQRLVGNEHHDLAKIIFVVIGLAAAAVGPDLLALALGDGQPLIGVLLARLVIEHHAELDRTLIGFARRIRGHRVLLLCFCRY